MAKNKPYDFAGSIGSHLEGTDMRTFLNCSQFVLLTALAMQPSVVIAREDVATNFPDAATSSQITHRTRASNAFTRSADEGEKANVRIMTRRSISGPAGSHAIIGAEVTYTIVAQIEGREPISDLKLSAPIDPKTQYVSGTLRLNGNLLTDANDRDEGHASNQRIDVALVEAPAGSMYEVVYTVMITG